MEITQETINILFLLMPGFIAGRVLDSVITRDTSDNFSKVIEALVFSFLIYSITNFIVDWEPLVSHTATSKGNHFAFSTNLTLLSITLGTAIILPLICGAFIHNDIHTKLFRVLKITDKTSRKTVRQDVFINEKRHIVASLIDGRRLYGWPMYYSHKTEENHLYLFQPAWVDDDGVFIECDTHGILLDYNKIEFIEFMFKGEEEINIFAKKEDQNNEST